MFINLGHVACTRHTGLGLKTQNVLLDLSSCLALGI